MVILIEAIKKQSLISMQILPSVDDGARLEIMNKPSIRKLVVTKDNYKKEIRRLLWGQYLRSIL